MHFLIWILLFLVFSGVFMTMLVSWIIYKTLLTRNKDEKWGRSPSMMDDEEYLRLYAQGEAWHTQYASFKKEVDVFSDGLHLWGEYYDFGSDKAVIIVPGRMEACVYSCHYSEPYRKAGWNVLTIDGRAHGKSDGKRNSLGYKEYRDLLQWAKLLHEKHGVRQIVFHGICIGSSASVFAASHATCPDYVAGIVADGMYRRFYDTFKLHMIKDKRPLFPFLWETSLLIWLFSGANIITDGPGKRIRTMKKSILFLHGKEDIFSLPALAQQMYNSCPAENKTLVWFDHGGHSKLRINNPEQYDAAVCQFLSTL